MVNAADLTELRVLVPGAEVMEEGGSTYVYLPKLRLPAGFSPSEVDGLLRPGPGPDGYTTRLFLSSAFPNKGQNWTVQHIFDRPWHTFSWNNVPGELRPMEILIAHLQVLR